MPRGRGDARCPRVRHRLSTGEQVTSGLLAITLEGMGINARSWQGWQLPILTSNAHASARILDVNGEELIKRFEERREVAVLAGFQGKHGDTNRITTLGRGGSDTSAVAIAAAIALEMIGPMPGTVISRSQPLFWRASVMISSDRASIRSSSRRQSPAKSSMTSHQAAAPLRCMLDQEHHRAWILAAN